MGRRSRSLSPPTYGHGESLGGPSSSRAQAPITRAFLHAYLGETRRQKRQREARLRAAHEAWLELPDGYPKYLKSLHWQDLQLAIRIRDAKRCRRCRSKGPLEVHHIHYRTLWRETGEELVTLCAKCHGREHKKPLLQSEARWTGKLQAVRSAQDFVPPERKDSLHGPVLRYRETGLRSTKSAT